MYREGKIAHTRATNGTLRVNHIVVNQSSSWDCDGVHACTCKSIHMLMHSHHDMRRKEKPTINNFSIFAVFVQN